MFKSLRLLAENRRLKRDCEYYKNQYSVVNQSYKMSLRAWRKAFNKASKRFDILQREKVELSSLCDNLKYQLERATKTNSRNRDIELISYQLNKILKRLDCKSS
jgi:hypothetical protein